MTVDDSGPGIPAELRLRVFEKFFRVEHTREGGARKPQGAGLGLYLCKQIVDAHGGTIRITSNPEGGTRLELTLPARA